jgi:glycosyltransferase involved in cell wall biosynthesis
MIRRRLLVLCYFYPPLAGGGVHRVLGFTRHLPAWGWDCTVVCAGAEDYWVRDESLMQRVPADTEVVRVPGGSALAAWLRWTRARPGRRSSGTFAGLRRMSDWWLLPDSYSGWAKRARGVSLSRVRKGGFDAVFSSSPPDSVHLAGLELKRRTRLPWVADFRDPWIGLYFRDPPTRWHRARQQSLERAVLASADVTVTASRTHAAWLEARPGARPARVVHIANGFEPDAAVAPAAPAPDAATAGERAFDPDHFTLAFTGTLSQMPDAEVFFEALHELFARRPEARRRLRMRIAGPYDSGYEDRSIALGLKGIVEFLGPLPHAATRTLQRAADVLLMWKPRGTPTMVPGKLYEYADSGRPMLALLPEDDEAAELVSRAGGERVAPGDRAALAASVERRYLAWKEAGRSRSARPAWLDDHTRARLAGQLASVLDSLAGSAR